MELTLRNALRRYLIDQINPVVSIVDGSYIIIPELACEYLCICLSGIQDVPNLYRIIFQEYSHDYSHLFIKISFHHITVNMVCLFTSSTQDVLYIFGDEKSSKIFRKYIYDNTSILPLVEGSNYGRTYLSYNARKAMKITKFRRSDQSFYLFYEINSREIIDFVYSYRL